MNAINKFSVLVLVLVSAVALVLAAPLTVGAEKHDKAETSESSDKDKDEAKEDSDNEAKNYRYTAQTGDSYTVLARKAVQSYGLVYDVNLSKAQIIYAETNLTQAANSPVLVTGEIVEIAQADVEKWVESAEKLDEETQALWQPYTVGVDFNTDNNGEAR